MRCYSQFSKTKIICETCEIAKYCEESIYKPKNNIVDLGLLDNVELHKNDTQDITVLSSVSTLFSELLHFLECNYENDSAKHNKVWNIIDILSTLYKVNPLTYQIILKKITKPHLSYQAIADELGIFKESVFYHLQKSKNVPDELKKGLLIDRRWQ